MKLSLTLLLAAVLVAIMPIAALAQETPNQCDPGVFQNMEVDLAPTVGPHPPYLVKNFNIIGGTAFELYAEDRFQSSMQSCLATDLQCSLTWNPDTCWIEWDYDEETYLTQCSWFPSANCEPVVSELSTQPQARQQNGFQFASFDGIDLEHCIQREHNCGYVEKRRCWVEFIEEQGTYVTVCIVWYEWKCSYREECSGHTH